MNRLFDLHRLDLRRLRARRTQRPDADFLLRRASEELLERLSVVQRSFTRAVDIMTPLPLLADELAASGRAALVTRLDRLAESAGSSAFAIGDLEAIPLRAESFDLVVSALALQTANDMPGAFAQIRFALKPDGLFLAVLAGGDTLTELRQSLAAAEAEILGGASPRVAPFASVRELGALLQRAGFALPVADQDRVTVRYSNIVALMHDLRAMGATNVLAGERLPLTRGMIARAGEIYAERFADDDGRLRATFDLVWLSGWAPHESQQKPLAPGSAKTRLADALGVAERPTGDKAPGGN